MADLLNQKIKSSFDKNQDRVLVTGMYGYNATTEKFDYAQVSDNGDLHVNIHGTTGGGDLKARSDIADPATSTFVKCNTDGTLEMTAELSSAGLATSAIQTDGTQKAQVLGNTEGDGSGTSKHIHVDSNGNVNSQIINTVSTNAFRTVIGDGSTNSHALVDANGHVQTDIVNTANVKFEDISSSLNSGTANDPANSLAVGLRGRQTITDASTETFLQCNSSGHLQVETAGTITITGDAQIKAEDDSASARNIRCNNSGHVKSQLIGNTVGDGSGTSKVVQVNDAGQLKTKLVAEDNTATRREVRCNTVGHLQTALLGNTAGDGSGTIKNVVTDSDGHLQVDVLSGGGGSSSNQYNNGGTEETLSVVKPTAPATGNITPATTILDLQNYKGVAFNVTTTSAGYTALTMGVEFSNVSNFSSTLGIGYNDIQIFDVPTDVGSNPISGQYQATILMIPEHNSQQPLGRYARLTFNHSNNAGSNVSVVINSTQIPH